MTIVEQVGRAIHNARKVGGPWGPACGYAVGPPGDEEWHKVDYDDNTVEFSCDCKPMAQHLLEELVKL